MTVLLTIVGRPHNPRLHQHHAVAEKDTCFLNSKAQGRCGASAGQVWGRCGAGTRPARMGKQKSFGPYPAPRVGLPGYPASWPLDDLRFTEDFP